MSKYRNTKWAIVYPLALAVMLALGLYLGNYFGRNNSVAQLRGVLQQMGRIPQNKLTHTLALIEQE